MRFAHDRHPLIHARPLGLGLASALVTLSLLAVQVSPAWAQSSRDDSTEPRQAAEPSPERPQQASASPRRSLWVTLPTANRTNPKPNPQPVTTRSDVARRVPAAGSGSIQRAGVPRDAAASVKGSSRANFRGYDFAVVVDRMSDSVQGLEQEMGTSLKQFLDSVNQAEKLLQQGDDQQAVRICADAVDRVLEAREQVLGPMWEGQKFLTEQIGWVRQRLAQAVEAAQVDVNDKLDDRSEKLLDSIAKRIAREDNPLRKKWLIGHYRTTRNLAQIKRMSVSLSPDQRAMWANVLSVLEEASFAHQQILMGSEVLFAQFQATAANLHEYMTLMETVDGAARLMQMVRGSGDNAAAMEDFAGSMTHLQQRLSTFSEAVEGVLQNRMAELEARIDSMAPTSDTDPFASGMIEPDAELNERLEALAGNTAGAPSANAPSASPAPADSDTPH